MTAARTQLFSLALIRYGVNHIIGIKKKMILLFSLLLMDGWNALRHLPTVYRRLSSVGVA